MPVPKLNRPPHPKPLVLVATSNVGHRHELAHMLSHAGFRVGSARDEPELLHQAHTEPPDAIVVDAEIAPPGYGLCGTLRTFALATPIVLTVAGGVTRSKEHEALRATRHGLALACAVFRPATQLPNHAAVDRLALAFKSAGRASDALGRTGRAEFAVFAPARNGTAARLVRRMSDNVERAFGSLREGHARVGVRSGYSTALAAHRISPPMLLARARSALEGSA